MARPVEMDLRKHLYLHPIELYVRDLYLEIIQKHGNGKWAFEELEWKIYVEDIDKYEALSEYDKIILNLYMKAFRSLYK